MVFIIKITNCKYELKYDYYISDEGYVYTSQYRRKLTTHLDRDGYVKVRMVCADDRRHTFSMHRLVAENYMPVENMENLQINHIDGNKQNNNLSNLEWCTCKYNVHHAEAIGLRNVKGENNPAAVLKNSDVLEIRNLRQNTKLRVQDIADMYGVSKGAIERVLAGKSFKCLLPENLKSSTTNI